MTEPGLRNRNILIGRMPAVAEAHSDVAMRAGILSVLADGPLTRAQLADLLHRRDVHVYAQLAVLREADLVIKIGRRRRARWALPGTVLPTRAPQPHHVSRPTSPIESWWTRSFATPEEFYRAARARAREMGWGRRSAANHNAPDVRQLRREAIANDERRHRSAGHVRDALGQANKAKCLPSGRLEELLQQGLANQTRSPRPPK
jgi:DNA-binding transcriptional ArsR family regulator